MNGCRQSWIWLLGLGLLGGCQTTTVQSSVASAHGADTPEAQIEFWHQLNDSAVACNDDAFHAVLLYVDGKDPNTDYAGRVAALKSRGMLPKDFNRPGNESVYRGILAVALVKAMNLKGGLMMHLVGPLPRYATRELYSEGVYPLSSPYQTFSGAELVGIMGRVEDYQRGNPVDRPAEQLPSDPVVPFVPE